MLDNIIKIAFIIAMTIVMAGITFISYKWVRSDGMSDFCYMQQLNNEPFISLFEHVPWHLDRRISIFNSFDEAAEVMNKLKCGKHN